MAYKISPKSSDAPEGFENVDRLSYTGQLLIARKFSTNFSLQLMPTIIHKNLVESYEENNQFALGIGGRTQTHEEPGAHDRILLQLQRPGQRCTLTEDQKQYDAFTLGIDIETGGHVFQLLLTNAIGLTERAFITETRDDFFAGDIHFGFNVTRTFQLKKNK